MSWLNKWKLTDRRSLQQLYGENTQLALRAIKMPVDKSVKEHSFKHLLNKVYSVEKINWPTIFTVEVPHRSYMLTEKDLARQALRVEKAREKVVDTN